MKQYLALVLALLVASLPITIPTALLVSCAAPAKTVAYRTLASIATTVDTGMKAFADAVVAGKVDAATEVKVKDVHGRYQKAMQAAILAARFNTDAPTPESVQRLSTELLDLVVAALK